MPSIEQVTIPGSNYQNGRALPIDQITFHHIVGDAPAAIARFKNPSQIVSATYVIGSDGKIYQCVAEGNTPYTDANFNSNSRAITIEHAGGIPSVPYTYAMYAASAQLVAWIKSRHNITRFMRHRDVSSTPTACPGALDVERILRQSENQGEFMGKWDNGKTYNLLFKACNAGIAERAKAANYVGYFGLQDGMDAAKAFDDIVGSPQFDFLVAEARAAEHSDPAPTPTPSPDGSYTAADRAVANETNSIVKQIWQKITSIFK